MARCLKAYDRLQDAEPLYREDLEGCRRILGSIHPNTLASINNMASCLEAQGRLEDVEPLFREALVGSRHIFGNDHPDTLTSISDMASCLEAQALESSRCITRMHCHPSKIWQRARRRKTDVKTRNRCAKKLWRAVDAFSGRITRVR